jgi:hypothetical protein
MYRIHVQLREIHVFFIILFIHVFHVCVSQMGVTAEEDGGGTRTLDQVKELSEKH